jgi:hypothetical protein
MSFFIGGELLIVKFHLNTRRYDEEEALMRPNWEGSVRLAVYRSEMRGHNVQASSLFFSG